MKCNDSNHNRQNQRVIKTHYEEHLVRIKFGEKSSLAYHILNSGHYVDEIERSFSTRGIIRVLGKRRDK